MKTSKSVLRRCAPALAASFLSSFFLLILALAFADSPLSSVIGVYVIFPPVLCFAGMGVGLMMRRAGFGLNADGKIEAQSAFAIRIERVTTPILRLLEVIARLLIGGSVIAAFAAFAPGFFVGLVEYFLLSPVPSVAGSILVMMSVSLFLYNIGWGVIRELLGERDIGYITWAFPFIVAGALGDLSLSGWQGEFYFSDLLPVIGMYIAVMTAEGMLMEFRSMLDSWLYGNRKAAPDSEKQKMVSPLRVQESVSKLQADEYPQISIQQPDQPDRVMWYEY